MKKQPLYATSCIEELNDFSMPISKVIKILQKLKKEHGDVIISTDAGHNNVEINMLIEIKPREDILEAL